MVAYLQLRSLEKGLMCGDECILEKKIIWIIYVEGGVCRFLLYGKDA